jgi:hypothetical protein
MKKKLSNSHLMELASEVMRQRLPRISAGTQSSPVTVIYAQCVVQNSPEADGNFWQGCST